ncbi:uncharacterized protein si:dkey-163f14.6 [Engraulis encrasicolus]|uniref:uncharacterized protein si:dkey-163f14.6 n=1 Tax=Engraulis encrasicolus TaxID=184585 RepID=UPI002FD22656
MEAHRGLILSFLLFLWTARSGFAGEPCRGFKHLENGRTFFRFKGLYATFTCHPGFRIHGHHTSSCVSGQWVREPPVCVASGCPSPGRVQYGSAAVNEDSSFVVFSCTDGYRLYGSPLSYCKGKTWSNPKPVCKESDIMSSMKAKPKVASGSNIEKKLHPRVPSNLKDHHFKSQYNTASKDAYLDSALLLASYPKPHISGGRLVKSKLQRRPPPGRKELLLMSAAAAAARTELASGVNKEVEVREELSRPQQMDISAAAAAAVALATPGPASGQSTKGPPLLTITTGTEVRKHKMDGGVSGADKITVSVKAGVLREKESREVTPSSVVSVAHLGQLETITVDQPSTGVSTSHSIDTSDKFLDAPPPEASDKSVDTVIHSTSSSHVVPVDVQNGSPKKPDTLTGSIKKLTDRVEITSDHRSDGLESIAEPKPGSVSLGVQPLLVAAAENDKEDAVEEPWEFSEKNVKPEQRNDGIAHVAVNSTEKLSLLQPTPQSVKPSVQTPTLQLTSDQLPLSLKPDTGSSSSVFQSIRSVVTELAEKERPEIGDEDGSEEARPPIGTKGGFEVLTEATQLKEPRRVKQAADATPASPVRLSLHLQRSHVQRSSTKMDGQTDTDLSMHTRMLMGQNSRTAKDTDMDMATNGSPAPKHQHQESHSAPAAGGSEGGFLPLYEVLAGATQLEPTQPAMEAPYTTPSSPMRLNHHQHQRQQQQSHVQQSSSMHPHTQIDQHSIAAKHTVDIVEAKPSPAPKHQHQHNESHALELDTNTVSLPDPTRQQTALLTDDPNKLALFTSSSSSSHTEPQSSTPSPRPPEPEPESFSRAPGLPELPVRRQRRPACPYPPLPAHGTFYFRTLAKPAPLQYRHYVQYACYPGYTLANGDVYSYCQQNATWSGVTPACLEVTPCLLNNGGCSQLCVAGPHHQAQCHCRPGFMLLEDQRTCRDVDECVEERHLCLQACVNTVGSFKCSCRTGFLLGEDGKTCVDTSECAVEGQAGCEWKCVNLSGSHQCVCPRGFRRHPDGRQCIDINECDFSNGGCSHVCKNLRGGYKCVCPPSHRISPSNRKKCLAITV